MVRSLVLSPAGRRLALLQRKLRASTRASAPRMDQGLCAVFGSTARPLRRCARRLAVPCGVSENIVLCLHLMRVRCAQGSGLVCAFERPAGACVARRSRRASRPVNRSRCARPKEREETLFGRASAVRVRLRGEAHKRGARPGRFIEAFAHGSLAESRASALPLTATAMARLSFFAATS